VDAADKFHVPVLLAEVLAFLNPHTAQSFVDGTAGYGGHASRLAEKLQPGGVLVVVDQDPAALAATQERLKPYAITLIVRHANFRALPSLLAETAASGETPRAGVDGILLDLGVSSPHLDAGERGFSFRAEARLDMRMNPTTGETAADLLAERDEREISRILWEYGEERWAARIAQRIVEMRVRMPLETTKQLADLVAAAIPKAAQPRDIHPATRTFQALRIAVNAELDVLRETVEASADCLAPGGRIGVIAYHSLEDRIVKQAFQWLSGKCRCAPGLPMCGCGAEERMRIVTRKPVLPTEAEVAANPRSRSAKLRVAERLRSED
jgi:16S rRNA (cytosine1402-N4)-methyltransferase